jgi:hypothetical protein
MPRPRLDPEDETVPVVIRMTRRQLRALDREAAKANTGRAAYVRRRLFGAPAPASNRRD